MHNSKAKVLIIRFSSFGDIVQALAAPALIKSNLNAEVHWLVREDFQQLVQFHKDIDSVISFSRKQGLGALLKLAWNLSKSGYTHVYDAHNNLRSSLIHLVFLLRGFLFREANWITRPKSRFARLLLFKFRLNLLPKPYRGTESFLWPLEEWSIQPDLPQAPLFFVDPQSQKSALKKIEGWDSFIALVPSAAWEMKRWPVAHWENLIRELSDQKFIILGGPEDKFCEQLKAVAPNRVLNMAGQMNLQESAAVIGKAKLVVSADTGLLHVADQLGKPLLALIGPTAFGYPVRKTSQVLERDLPCKPCSKDGRGRCVQEVYQKCMVDIGPAEVAKAARTSMGSLK